MSRLLDTTDERIADALERIATVLENMERCFVATSVEEVAKRVEEMKKGRR